MLKVCACHICYTPLPPRILEKFSILVAETREPQPTDDAASSRSRRLQDSSSDWGNVSTFSALSAYCQIDNADITVTGDITFTGVITITGRTVSIASTTDAVLTSDRSFSANTGGMLFIDDGADVTLTGLHFVSGSASLYGGCLGVDSSDLAVFNSSFTSCVSQDAHAHAHATPETTAQ